MQSRTQRKQTCVDLGPHTPDPSRQSLRCWIPLSQPDVYDGQATACRQGPRRNRKIKRSRGGRWSWTFELAQKRSWVGRWSWAAKVGLLSLRVVPQQQCNGHRPCDSAQTWQLKQQLRSALVAGQWRGDTALTLPLFWRRSTVSPVFFGRYPRSSLHSFVPFPPRPPPPPPPRVPVPNKPPRFCGRQAKWSCLPSSELRSCVKVEVDVLGSRPCMINLWFLWT